MYGRSTDGGGILDHQAKDKLINNGTWTTDNLYGKIKNWGLTSLHTQKSTPVKGKFEKWVGKNISNLRKGRVS